MNSNVLRTAPAAQRRRPFALNALALSLALLLPAVANGAGPTAATRSFGMESISFDNSGIAMAGNLYLPARFDKSKKYPAIVVAHPGGGVKEQTAGLYARHLAEQGFIALAFDASHQGASGGEPRFLNDPMKRVGDVYSAVDYLTTLPGVDDSRIGALGICAGSGASVKAAMTERRIRAIATVSAWIGSVPGRGWNGDVVPDQRLATLDAVAKQRTAEAAGAAPVYTAYVPKVGDRTAPRDLQEAAEYYLTPRGQHPNAPNKQLLTSAASEIAFDGFAGADVLLTQPLLMIAGSEAGSRWQSETLIAKAAGPKELFIVKGATHMTLYDRPADVKQAVAKLSTFFTNNL